MSVAKDVVVGVVQTPFGVKGWVKLHSYTDPIDNIFDYSPWVYLGDPPARVKLCEGRRNGIALIARMEGIHDRDAAAELRGCEIHADRSSFPPAAPGEYYWADLIGLSVRNTQGVIFGTVSAIMATGANDVMVVDGEKERLVPFVMEHFVREINLEQGYILVEWDEDF